MPFLYLSQKNIGFDKFDLVFDHEDNCCLAISNRKLPDKDLDLQDFALDFSKLN